ncbi:hypothetical protein [Synechococcus elongatus]|uniref:hypothetical protein n=1 Tax=Synechococcus elongatus TaxID=32046 RepID=UPI0030CC04FA
MTASRERSLCVDWLGNPDLRPAIAIGMANPTFGNRDSGRSVGRSYQSLWLLLGITTIFFGALGGRLAYMQIQQGERNRELANENRHQLLPLYLNEGASSIGKDAF